MIPTELHTPPTLDHLWDQLWNQAHSDPNFQIRPASVTLRRFNELSGATLNDLEEEFYKIGDYVRIDLSLPRAGYLIILERGTSHQIFCLSPSIYVPDPWIKHTGIVSFPRANSKYRSFRLYGQPGREELIALLFIESPSLEWLNPEKVSEITPMDLQTLLQLIQTQPPILSIRMSYLIHESTQEHSDHHDLARNLNSLAKHYRDQRSDIEAETLYLQGLDLWRQLLGEHDPEVIKTLWNLESLYESQGRHQEAAQIRTELIDLYRAEPNQPSRSLSLPMHSHHPESSSIPDPLDWSQIQVRIARLYLDELRGNYELGIQNLKKARIFLSGSAQNLTLLAEVIFELGRLYHRIDRYSQARLEFKDAVRLYHRLGKEDQAAAALMQLGSIEMRLNRTDHAQHHYQAALEIYRRYNQRDKVIEIEKLLGFIRKAIAS